MLRFGKHGCCSGVTFDLRSLSRLIPRETAHLVGRTEELQILRDALQGVVRGTGSTILIAARIGLGKSALLEHYHSVASRNGAIISARCSPTAQVWSTLRAEIGPPEAETGDICAWTPGVIDDVLRCFIAAARRRPQVLLVDDVHLANEADLEILGAIVDISRRERVVLVATFTQMSKELPSKLAGKVARWCVQGAHLRKLEPLSENEMALLVRNTALSTATVVDSRAAQDFITLSRGNPRYLLELLSDFRKHHDSADLVPFSAAAEAAALKGSACGEAAEVLSVAAVLGERFSDAWLQKLLEMKKDTIAGALQLGIDRGLIAEAPDRVGFYVFCDLAIQKALYVAIVGYRRRLLHARAAKVLISGRIDDSHDDMIASHLDAAGERAQAAEWLLRSAVRCARLGLHRTAAELYERAANCMDSDAAKVSLQEDAARCYEDAGAIERALPLRERVISSPDVHRDSQRFVTACAALMDDYWWIGKRRDVLNVMKLLEAVQSSSSRQAVARAALGWALRLCADGLEPEAQAAFDAVRQSDLLKSDGPRYCLVAAMLRSGLESVERTIAALSAAADLAEKAEDVRLATLTLIEAANFACRIGQLESSISLADRASRRAAACDDSSKMTLWTAILQTDLRILVGDLKSAREITSSILAVRGAGDLWEMNLAAFNVFIGMRIGDPVLVDSFFDLDLLWRVVATAQPGSCATLLYSYPEAMVARGLTRELKHVLQLCADKKLCDPYFVIPLAQARFGALECVESARSQIQRRETRTDIGMVATAAGLLFDAFVARRRRNPSASRRAALLAGAAYRKLKWPLYEAQALELAGDAAAARDLYQKCGAVYDADRLCRRPTRKSTQAFLGARLTPREREVLEKIRSGDSDATIALALGISVRTVNHHVEAIFSKLGIRARWQLSAVPVPSSPAGRVASRQLPMTHE